ncbi:MAG: hypothetical protein J2P59_05405, partial [Acidimicrobiales bacterium]|nr:hypothetical protein [Acidimicrobiales bacterium]
MSFGGKGVPAGHVVRTFRAKVMATPGQRRRCLELLEGAGDAWAFCIDRFHERRRNGLGNANSLGQLWPDQKAHGPFGELSAHCAQDVTKAWSAAFFESMRRRSAGQKARLPLRKRHRVPVTWRKGEFYFPPRRQGGRPRVVLLTRRGSANVELRLSHDDPYDQQGIRAVRLVEEAGALFVDLTAFVAVVPAALDEAQAAGVDVGIIHPLALAYRDRALVVSGRALRAEEFLHLADTKDRQRRQSTKRAP